MSDKPSNSPAPAAEPAVELTPRFVAGGKIRHLNRQTYLVREVTPEGLRLEGVANLVHPSACRPLDD
jgi:hypothetical protein